MTSESIRRGLRNRGGDYTRRVADEQMKRIGLTLSPDFLPKREDDADDPQDVQPTKPRAPDPNDGEIASPKERWHGQPNAVSSPLHSGDNGGVPKKRKRARKMLAQVLAKIWMEM